MILVKLMALPMMIKVLAKTRRPFACAFLYLGLMITQGFLFDLALGATWQSVTLAGLKELAASALYFWLLNELEGNDGLYWGVLALGMLGLLLM